MNFPGRSRHKVALCNQAGIPPVSQVPRSRRIHAQMKFFMPMPGIWMRHPHATGEQHPLECLGPPQLQTMIRAHSSQPNATHRLGRRHGNQNVTGRRAATCGTDTLVYQGLPGWTHSARPGFDSVPAVPLCGERSRPRLAFQKSCGKKRTTCIRQPWKQSGLASQLAVKLTIQNRAPPQWCLVAAEDSQLLFSRCRS